MYYEIIGKLNITALKSLPSEVPWDLRKSEELRASLFCMVSSTGAVVWCSVEQSPVLARQPPLVSTEPPLRQHQSTTGYNVMATLRTEPR